VISFSIAANERRTRWRALSKSSCDMVKTIVSHLTFRFCRAVRTA
jgi:hypothetical protein